MTTLTPTVDATRVEEFAERLISSINDASLTLMVSIGHRTGLFDVLSEMPASSSADIAREAGLQERYVREWLNCMVTGAIVEYRSDANTYRLPPEHTAVLTRAASPANMAVFAQFFAVLGAVEDRIVECFRDGGGVSYPEFHRFHDVMAEESSQTVVAALFDHILPLAPGLVEKLEAGIHVLDVGCGAGRALIAMAEAYPNSNFTGIELTEVGVNLASREAERRGLSNVRFELRDATDFDLGRRFDLITAFDAIHDQAHPDRVLRAIRRALTDDGVFLMQDIGLSCDVLKNANHPLGTFVYTISCMHCMTVSLAQGGCGLGAAWGEETAVRMLEEAGFEVTGVHRLEHDIMNNYYLAK